MNDERQLLNTGRSAWAFVGIVAAAATIYFALAYLSGLVIPLVIAAVIGMLFTPVVDRVERYVPRSIASGLVLIGLIGLGYWTTAVTVTGIVEQAPEIGKQIRSGLEAFVAWLANLGWDIADPEQIVNELEEILSSMLPGLASLVGSAFTTVAAFLAGTLMALFFLYFVLADWAQLSGWVGRHLGVAPDLGEAMVEDTVWSMRQYFYVLTLSSLITAVVTGVTMVALGLPLAFTVAVVTFITSYVPYLGAIFSGSFAFLIALGAGGVGDAIIILLVILVVQNVVQPLVNAKLTESALHIHPVVVFGSTIVGAAVAGILGATLSAPIVAMLVAIHKRIANARKAAVESP
ncbi:MAG: AI-2E family transporter [Actinomycetota bacterium]